MTSVIITSIAEFTNSSHRVRLNPSGGELRIEKYTGGAWNYVGGYKEVGNTNNEFRWIIDGTKLKVQQIKDGGAWSGVEGVDFTTVTEYNEI